MPGIILNIYFTHIRVLRDITWSEIQKLQGCIICFHQADHPYLSFLLIYWNAGRRPGSWTCPLLWLCWEDLTCFSPSILPLSFRFSFPICSPYMKLSAVAFTFTFALCTLLQILREELIQCFTETGLECLKVGNQPQSLNHGLTSMCDLQVALTYFCNSGLVMMPKAWPLCTGAESNLGNRIVGEVDKEKLYCFARQIGI